ncbi:hypothetical protein PPO43_15220 [Saprospira sp. CCB-QB6]|uniref:hypothetical protein n=1 Tax=Saprospira sp. CCB-QB6 TaxID=3023936 RepID=UPI00234B6114|nr:hypothetical protein [Saprospira sp. CCB-QB6]WCL81325.1 hypothetical protein PPO43_15220 [Saprospira sp. CCB-QB6]
MFSMLLLLFCEDSQDKKALEKIKIMCFWTFKICGGQAASPPQAELPEQGRQRRQTKARRAAGPSEQRAAEWSDPPTTKPLGCSLTTEGRKGGAAPKKNAYPK